MAINFTCPHCGKSMLVDERFAGQTGPCASCGSTITISGISSGSDANPPISRANSAVVWIIGIMAVVVAAMFCLVVMGAALLMPALTSARTAAQRAQSMNNMKQIGLALHNYHSMHGSFPPAYVSDAQGKPLYSWRVLILPQLEQQALYDQFDKTKAWDAPENIALSTVQISQFQSPLVSAASANATHYYCFVSPKTAFPGNRGCKIQEITDGTSNTLLVVEAMELPGGSWAAPVDFDVSQTMPTLGNGVGQVQPILPNELRVLMSDGAVRTVPIQQANGLLPLLIDRADGQIVPPF